MTQPRDAFEALEAVIPPSVNFYRAPITSSDATSQDMPSSRTSIYGSVSTTDIASNIKALLATSALAGKIVLADSDVHFTSTSASIASPSSSSISNEGEAGAGQETATETTDSNRVKHLGNYSIEIRIKGHTEAVKRQVRVLPEDAFAGTEDIEAFDAQRNLEGFDEVAGENPIAGVSGNSETGRQDLDELLDEIRLAPVSAEAMEGESGKGGTEKGGEKGAFGQPRGSQSAIGAKNEGAGGKMSDRL